MSMHATFTIGLLGVPRRRNFFTSNLTGTGDSLLLLVLVVGVALLVKHRYRYNSLTQWQHRRNYKNHEKLLCQGLKNYSHLECRKGKAVRGTCSTRWEEETNA